MKSKLLAGAAVATALIASGASASEPGWYGAIDVGAHHQFQAQGTPNAPGFDGFQASTKWNVVGFARVGYQVVPHLRLELEGGYRPGKLKALASDPSGDYYLCAAGSGATNACVPPGGSINAWSVMGNVLFDIMPDGKIDPFFGGGIGAVNVKTRISGDLVGPAVGPRTPSGAVSATQVTISRVGFSFPVRRFRPYQLFKPNPPASLR